MNRLSKDIDRIDNVLPGLTSLTQLGRASRSDFGFADSFRMFLDTSFSVMGAIILISTLFPRFLIIVAIIFVLYAMAALFYRAGARETKVCASQT